MKYHLVLQGQNGFTREEEVELKHLPPLYRVRRLVNFAYTTLEEIKEPTPDPIRSEFDMEFRLKATFFALGKNIAYYVEY